MKCFCLSVRQWRWRLLHLGGLTLDVSHCVVKGSGNIVDVLGGETAHVDTTAAQQVDVVILDKMLALLGCKTTKHVSNFLQICLVLGRSSNWELKAKPWRTLFFIDVADSSTWEFLPVLLTTLQVPERLQRNHSTHVEVDGWGWEWDSHLWSPLGLPPPIGRGLASEQEENATCDCILRASDGGVIWFA